MVCGTDQGAAQCRPAGNDASRSHQQQQCRNAGRSTVCAFRAGSEGLSRPPDATQQWQCYHVPLCRTCCQAFSTGEFSQQHRLIHWCSQGWHRPAGLGLQALTTRPPAGPSKLCCAQHGTHAMPGLQHPMKVVQAGHDLSAGYVDMQQGQLLSCTCCLWDNAAACWAHMCCLPEGASPTATHLRRKGGRDVVAVPDSRICVLQCNSSGCEQQAPQSSQP